jgi:hypothetical protein
MTSNKTEGLIVDLAAELVPVNVLPSVSVRFSRWLIGAAVTAGLWIAVFGLRPDASRALGAPPVLAPLVLALIASLGAGVAAIRLSVPGVNASWWGRWAPVAVLAALAGLLAAIVRPAGEAGSALLREPFHTACILRVIAMSAIPAVMLAREIWRGFPLHRMAGATLAVLGGGGLATAAVQLVCPIDRPAHLLVSHALPVISLVVFAALAASMLTSRRPGVASPVNR